MAPAISVILHNGEACDLVLLTVARSTLGAYRGQTGKPAWNLEVPSRNPPSLFSGPEPALGIDDMFVTHARDVVALETDDLPMNH